MKQCKCGAISAGGGNEYLKRIGYDDDIIELNKYDIEEEQQMLQNQEDLVVTLLSPFIVFRTKIQIVIYEALYLLMHNWESIQ